VQNTTFTTHSTTNSPHFYHHQAQENRKTPSKKPPFARQNIFLQNIIFPPSKPIEKLDPHAASEVVLRYPAPKT
jgi:hypothetical protein